MEIRVISYLSGRGFRKIADVVFLVSCLIIIAGCQRKAEVLETATLMEGAVITSEPRPSATVRPLESAAPAITETTKPTQSPVTAEPTLGPAATPITLPPTPTSWPPTATALPPTAAFDIPPAEHFNVDTPDRRASDCSPDYPCNDDVAGWESRMRVPPGFETTYFAQVGGRPTAMTVGPDGNLYVSVVTGTIYTISSEGAVSEFYQGLKVPTGLAFQPGSSRLYVSSRLVDDYIAGEGQVAFIDDGALTQVLDGLPCCYIGMHGPNGIAFGPDGFGYVGVGGRADHGEILIPPNDGEQDELHPFEASILRFSPNGEDVEVFARGFRNPYDLAWDVQGQLYATDNGRDGGPEEEAPPDELHVVVPGGEHGYPYFECPNCFSIPEDIEVIQPIHELVRHGAVAGITAYVHDAFPGYYNDLFLVLWSAFTEAQRVLRVGRDRTVISDFATGFAAPIDIVVGPEGSLYVADFATGIIFRISYVGEPGEEFP